MDLRDATVLVSGGGSGLGAATAAELARAGARVIVFDLDGAAAEAVAAAVGGLAAQGNVCDPIAVDRALALAQTPLRGAISCAGIAGPGRILGREGPLPLEDFERVVRINLVGTFNVLRLSAARIALSPPLADGARGAIVNTASVAAEDGQIGQAGYAAAKGGIAAMALPAARELARLGIRVNTVAPGVFETPLLAGLPQETRDGIAAVIPHPSRLGRPQEFAATVRHCLENDYLNAAFIRLDGGVRLPPR